MTPTFQDTIKMRGDLTIIVREAATGLVVKRIEIRNKITFLAADVIVELLAQRVTDPEASANAIYSMRMGTSNTAAARSDTDLGVYLIAKELADVNKVTGVPGELTLSATLETTDANGETLREAGIFTKGDALVPTPSDAAGTVPGAPRMLCRQTHPEINKSVSLSVEYSWRLAFTA